MTSTAGELEVFRTDVSGRVRVPVERREALLDEFERSGLSGGEFARLVGLKYQTFANWVQQRKKRREAPAVTSTTGVRLIEATVEEQGSAPGMGAGPGGLLIELPGGGRVHVESPLQLRLAAELLGMMANAMNARSRSGGC